MKLLRFILLTLTIAIGMPAMADDYKFLSISQTDNVATVEVDNIDKITFDTADMVLHLSNGTEQRFPLANLSKMSFNNDPSSIVTLEHSGSSIYYDGDVLRVNVAAGERMSIYNMKGEQVFTSNHTTTLQLNNLPKGIYIVKAGQNETKKILNKR